MSQEGRQLTEDNLALVSNVDKLCVALGMAAHMVGEDDGMDSLLRKADADMYNHKAAIKQVRLEQKR